LSPRETIMGMSGFSSVSIRFVRRASTPLVISAPPSLDAEMEIQ